MKLAGETCQWQHINTRSCSGARTLTLCYSKRCLWTSNKAITWELWKRYHLMAHARSPCSESVFLTKSSNESYVPKTLRSSVVDMYVYIPCRSGAHTYTHMILICDSSLDLTFFLTIQVTSYHTVKQPVLRSLVHLCSVVISSGKIWKTENLRHLYLPISTIVLLCIKYCCCGLVSKWCPTLCNPMDCSPPGSSVHGISQARILEWVAIPFSSGSSWPRDQTLVSSISCIDRWVLYY